jgi:hypothetical protein
MALAAPRQRVVVTRIGERLHGMGQMRLACKLWPSPTPATPTMMAATSTRYCCRPP